MSSVWTELPEELLLLIMCHYRRGLQERIAMRQTMHPNTEGDTNESNEAMFRRVFTKGGLEGEALERRVRERLKNSIL